MKRGFTLIEAMLALFFSSFLLLIVVMMYQGFYQYRDNLSFYDQNKTGFIQLQNEFTVSSDFEMKDESLCYEKFENEYCLSFDKDRLVKKPGYEILLVDIKEGSLWIEGSTIVIGYNKDTIYFKTIP